MLLQRSLSVTDILKCFLKIKNRTKQKAKTPQTHKRQKWKVKRMQAGSSGAVCSVQSCLCTSPTFLAELLTSKSESFTKKSELIFFLKNQTSGHEPGLLPAACSRWGGNDLPFQDSLLLMSSQFPPSDVTHLWPWFIAPVSIWTHTCKHQELTDWFSRKGIY